MKKLIALLFFCILGSAAVLRHNWEPVKNTKVNFVIDGMFGKDVRGTISGFTSEIQFYPDDLPRSTIRAKINPATIDTDNKKRDSHLKTSDFLDVEKFPGISFASKRFRQVGEYFVVEGDLTLKDITKTITIPFEFITRGDSAVFNGDFNINRLDYNVGKKSMFMGNDVRIHLNIPVGKK